MKKMLFTLNINNYEPEICAITYPLLKYYAKKIGAEFFEITERRYPDFPICYEKMQVYDLAQQFENEWNIYIDADAMVHPETIDFTLFLPKNTVAHNGKDFAPIRWKYDKYFLRDGRHVGSCNWLSIASNWCVDLWKPLDISLDKAIENIFPTIEERNSRDEKGNCIVDAKHLIDDYTLSRNIAKYGLKFTTLMDLTRQIGMPQTNFFHHIYTVQAAEKLESMKKVMLQWRLE